MSLQKPAIDRVLNRVVRLPWSGCWIFTGATNEFGYGIVGKGGRGAGNDRAHRITYAHFHGAIPDGMFVCHHCDTPSCCNPDHLFIGTHQDNMRDCVTKLRHSNPPKNEHIRGEVHVGHKLTDQAVREIRALVATVSRRLLAKQHGVCRQTIDAVVDGKRWRHVQ